MKNILVLLLCLLSVTCYGIETTAIKDRAGRTIGTRTTSSNGKYSTYRSRSGVVTRTKTTQGRYDFYKSRSGVSTQTRVRPN